MEHSQKVVAVPPGATIREQLQNRGMSQKEFAIRMDMSEKHISHLINGKVELTQDVAQRLDSVLGIPAKYWNRLELAYREQLNRVKLENENKNELDLAAKFPYKKLVQLGWVMQTNNREEQLNQLRHFFEVARLNVINSLSINNSDYFQIAKAQKDILDKREKQR